MGIRHQRFKYYCFGTRNFLAGSALLQMNLIVHCPEKYNLANAETSIVIAFVAVGIGLVCTNNISVGSFQQKHNLQMDGFYSNRFEFVKSHSLGFVRGIISL